jgi:hypothetical protein
VAGVACIRRYLTKGRIGGDLPFLLPSTIFHPARVSAFMSSAIIAPPLDTITYILIETLLDQGFENKLIALKAKCSKRTV